METVSVKEWESVLSAASVGEKLGLAGEFSEFFGVLPQMVRAQGRMN